MGAHNSDPNNDGRNQRQPGIKHTGKPMLSNPAIAKDSESRRDVGKKVKKIFK